MHQYDDMPDGADIPEEAFEAEEGISVELGQSLLEAIQGRREHLELEQHVDLPIPGYDDRFLMRYRALPIVEIQQIAKKHGAHIGGRGSVEVSADVEARKTRAAAADILIAASMEAAIANDGKRIPLHKIVGGGPVRFGDPRLAAAAVRGLDEEAAKKLKARQIVQKILPREMTLVSHQAELVEWMQKADERVNDALSGESNGTT